MSERLPLDEHRFPRALLAAIGFRGVVAIDRDARSITALYEAAPAFAHSGGAVVQGGIAAAWIDNAMAIAVEAHAPGTSVATLDLHLSWPGRVTVGTHAVRARVVKAGRTIVFLEAEVGAADDVLVRASSSGRLFAPTAS